MTCFVYFWQFFFNKPEEEAFKNILGNSEKERNAMANIFSFSNGVSYNLKEKSVDPHLLCHF